MAKQDPRIQLAKDSAAFIRAQKRKAMAHKQLKSTKIGRNEPCPCNSGRKYKKCCLIY